MPYATNNTFGGRTQWQPEVPVQPTVNPTPYYDPIQAMWDNWAPSAPVSNPFAGAKAGALFPQSEVDAAIRSGTMMPAGPNWSAPSNVAQAGTLPQPLPTATPSAPVSPYDALFAQLGNTSATISPYQQAQLDAEKWQFSETQNRLQQQATAEAKWREQQIAQQTAQQAAETAYRQQQLAADQAWRTQQIENDKQQRLATLAAQPKSWLEYAALANQAPVVQPWMTGLNQGKQQVGEQISGWGPTNMTGMQDLITPSAQYMARMTPSAREQYYGYQQADTGATEEDTQWQLWNQAPAGSVKNLSYSR